jgi:broad specificity phosphatase PhoE
MKSLIIRHAHREKMPSELGQNIIGFQENLMPITEEGEKAAQSMGNSLSVQYDFITFSSVLRCKQTANAINYLGTLKNIGESAYLVSEYFGNLSHYNEKEKQIAIESLLNREDHLGLGLHKKMESILDFFKENTKLGNGIYVTHDWWMALFLSYFTDLYEKDGYNIWPDFLEYFEIDFGQNSIIYRNKILTILLTNH